MDIFGGTGFIGSKYLEMYGGNKVPRDVVLSPTGEILYFISTTDNYNVFEDPQKDIEVNLRLLIDVLDKNKGKIKCFNFISSWFVYGDCKDKVATEDSMCQPKGFYSITKKCAEDLLISYCKTFGIDYRIMRLCNVYGKGDRFSKKKNALQWLIEKIKNNEDIELYNGGNFTRSYMHVYDVCRAINLVINKGPVNEITNIAMNHYEFKYLIEYVINYLGSNSKIITINPPEFHKVVQVANIRLSSGKLESLGFEEEVSIFEGLECISQ